MVHIHTKQTGEVTVLVIQGDIDASSSIQLDDALKQLSGAGKSHILVDCSQLNYISSAGLGVFMSYIEELNENHQKMILFALSKKVKNVFDMLGLDQLMKFAPSEEQALTIINEA